MCLRGSILIFDFRFLIFDAGETVSQNNQTLTGAIERITYHNPENGYSVIRLRPDRGSNVPPRGLNRAGLLTGVGNLPELTPGEHVKLRGRFTTHPKHGYQFQIEVCEQTLPATTAGIQRYLGSGLVKGIGAKMAERIVEHFGVHTLDVIEQQPQRLREVPDIGPKRTRLITAAWHEQKQVKEIMLFLHSYGVSTNLAIKIYKTYGDQAMQTVQTNPYQLARDIHGVGFKTADKIAQALGLARDHPARVEAGILYALNEMNNDGHVYAPAPELAERAVELLEVEPELIQPGIERLAKDDRVKQDTVPLTESPAPDRDPGASRVAEALAEYGVPAIYPTPFFYGEIGVARRLAALARCLPSRLSSIPPAFVALPGNLSEEQKNALQTALTHPVSILTGGPGTGKTTCLQALISILESHQKRYALCSPTGRAAKRLSEATERPASTIHRLLEFSPLKGFTRNDENPLPIDLLVVDETSMLDLILTNSLLKALEPGTHVLLVGDVDQLPSVGAGDVLRDVIASDLAPVTRLSIIFRQAAGSHIITNAHRINQGEFPEFPRVSPAEGDFFFFPAEDAEAAGNWVTDVVTERIPRTFGLDPLADIQVLAPMYRGPAGVHALNERLQAALNPSGPLKPQKTLYGQTFRPGDKVMQTQNDYDKEVFNGDIGRVAALDPINHTMTLDYEGRAVVYDWTECDALVLAYAVSVHKGQGAEFPAVVLPLVTQHYMMLQRNLLYTAVTRAKRLCVLVGSRRAIGIAVKNNKVAHRHTALDWRLQKGA